MAKQNLAVFARGGAASSLSDLGVVGPLSERERVRERGTSPVGYSA
jgi:hypothetical protein